MRYIPNSGGSTPAARLSVGGRPPLEKLPEPLVKLLVERDRVAEQASHAETELRRLLAPEEEERAKALDAAASIAAARAGKVVLPRPKALPALMEAREAAERAFETQRAALLEVTNDAEEEQTRAHEAATDPRPAALEKINILAATLADAVDDAVAECAVYDWLGQQPYYLRADVWPVDIAPDLKRHGLTRGNTTHTAVRGLITRAASAALEEN